jgi:hypothetical protein
MKEFMVGLLVILIAGVVTLFGALFFPLLLLLGFFLRFLIGLIVSIFVIWLIGKTTLLAIEHFRKPSDQ